MSKAIGTISISIDDGPSLENALRFFRDHGDEATAIVDVFLDIGMPSMTGTDYLLACGDSWIRSFFAPRLPNATRLLNAIQGASKARITDLIASDSLFSDAQEVPAKQELLQFIGQIPSLEHINWRGRWGRNEIPTALKNLTTLLDAARGSPKFVTLVCMNCSFGGSQQEFANFARALRLNPQLEMIHFGESTLFGEEMDQKIRPVLQALSELSEISSLDVGCWTPHQGQRVLLSEIFGAKKLGSLSVRSSAFMTGFPSIQASKSIHTLSVKGFRFEEGECGQLGDLVRTNKFIQNLTIEAGPSFQDDGNLTLFIQAFEENSTLTRLNFDFKYWSFFLSNAVQAQLLAMLETNVSIQFLAFDGSRSRESNAVLDKIQYYVKLNQLGRKAFVDPSTSKAQLVKALASAKNDVKDLFYLLSLKPSLCDVGPGVGPGVELGHE